MHSRMSPNAARECAVGLLDVKVLPEGDSHVVECAEGHELLEDDGVHHGSQAVGYARREKDLVHDEHLLADEGALELGRVQLVAEQDESLQ